MSKKNRQEFSQAKNHQSNREAFNAAVVQHSERAAQEKSASYAAASWPDSLAERRGFDFARLTGGNHGMAVAASKVYGFFGARLFMKGFLSATGPAPYEREG
jgi:hypothetical protein